MCSVSSHCRLSSPRTAGVNPTCQILYWIHWFYFNRVSEQIISSANTLNSTLSIDTAPCSHTKSYSCTLHDHNCSCNSRALHWNAQFMQVNNSWNIQTLNSVLSLAQMEVCTMMNFCANELGTQKKILNWEKTWIHFIKKTYSREKKYGSKEMVKRNGS